MPASWQPAAVQAQAIAARSYGEYGREHAQNSAYDICDTTQCQVYGGMTHYSATGAVLWQDDPAAVVGDAGQVLRYNGATAFTQFAASNGGWTTDGGQPYLIAKADPYDDAASGDPYLSWTTTAAVSDLAAYYGLARVTEIDITGRDGHGQWGGRVTAGTVRGVTSGGASAAVTTTGFGLQAALGLPSTWFTIQSSNRPIGHLDSVTAVAPHVARLAGWSYDPDHPSLPGRIILTMDGVAVFSGETSVARPDVQAVQHTATNLLGFSVTASVGPGIHTACLYGVDRDGLGNNQIECLRLSMSDVLGSVDAVTPAGLRSVTVVGWSFDPSDTAAPGRVQAYVDGGATSGVVTTSLPRPDVQSFFHTAIDSYGYSFTVPVPGGSHSVCVYGLDATGTSSVPLRCVSVTMPQNPLGNVEHVSHTAAGYTISGWAFDPDALTASASVEIYLGGTLAATVEANGARPDVQAIYGLPGDSVGFSVSIPASATKREVKVVAVNAGPGTNSTLVDGWA
jgi:hypothetical protein